MDKIDSKWVDQCRDHVKTYCFSMNILDVLYVQISKSLPTLRHVMHLTVLISKKEATVRTVCVCLCVHSRNRAFDRISHCCAH